MVETIDQEISDCNILRIIATKIFVIRYELPNSVSAVTKLFIKMQGHLNKVDPRSYDRAKTHTIEQNLFARSS